MRMHELAFFARVFVIVDAYDAATVDLRALTGPAVDPSDRSHHGPLLTWLRRWGCRQFAKDAEAVVSDDLAAWWENSRALLPTADATLDQLPDEALENIGRAYDDLRTRTASHASEATGRPRKTFGPVGAAKALHAIRPKACAPWDTPIKDHFAFKDDGGSYVRHLVRIREELSEAVADLGPGGDAAQIPKLVGRPDASPVKLVDEADWIRFTRGGEAPNVDVLRQWIEWGRA